MNMKLYDAIIAYMETYFNQTDKNSFECWLSKESVELLDYSGITAEDCVKIQLGLAEYLDNHKILSPKELKSLLQNAGISRFYKPDDEYTTDEHYIARMYLKRFATVSANSKKFIWQYNLQTFSHQPNCEIQTKDICFEKDLYEYKDENNAYINRNEIEDILSEFESVFSNLFDSIEEKAKTAKGIINNFLDIREQSLLKLYLVLQLLRLPKTISIAQELIEKNASHKLKSYESKNLALRSCLDAFISDKLEIDETNIYFDISDWFSNMCFIIGKSENEDIITGDMPIYLFSKPAEGASDSFTGIQKVVFPISSTLVLIMYPHSKTKREYNCLTPLSERTIQDVQFCIATVSTKWIYSKYRITSEQERIIKKAKDGKE